MTHALIPQIPSGQGMQLVRVHGGVVCAVPPVPPIMAEDPSEALLAIAVFIGMRVPRKRDDAPDLGRYPWAGKKILCPPGSQLLVVKTERANGQSESYLLTNHVAGNHHPTQFAAWNPMGVLTHANAWLTSLPINTHVHLNGIRIEEELNTDDEDVFSVRIAATSILGPDDNAPNPAAPWTLLCEEPMMRVGLVSDILVAYLKDILEGASEGHFAARLRNTLLEIGQQVEPDYEEDEGDDTSTGTETH